MWCGIHVEVRENGFFEGCWAGDFARFDFDQSVNVFGSGGKATGDSALFVPPSHTLEVLYALEKGGKVVVSNSLAFLVNVGNVELPFDYDIGTRFASILKGIRDYERVLFRGDGWTLYRIAREHIRVRGGRMTLESVEEDLPFRTFDEYRSYLLTVIGKAFENGRSSMRKHQFAPVTTCSNGYDSPACAALVSTLGCDQALSMTTARGGKADSGREIAEQLGMRVQEFQREPKSTDRAFGEAEFLASGMGGEDYVFNVLGPSLANKMMVNGFMGGAVWELNAVPSSTMTRKDCSGSNLTEHRLRHGYLLLPVVTIGSIHQEQVLRIGASEEMRPYRVGGDYDRPVPRRLAEERGIPRHSFGQVKKGNSICFNYSSLWWSHTALADLKKFERRTVGPAHRFAYHSRRLAHTAVVAGYYLALKICRSIKATWLPKAAIKWLVRDFQIYEHNNPRYANLTFLWALDKVRQRYPSGQLPMMAFDAEPTEVAPRATAAIGM